jgi:competence protein ComEC
MTSRTVYFWKSVPFIRLLIPFIIGIIAQWYIGFSLYLAVAAAAVCISGMVLFNLLPVAKRFYFSWIPGPLIMFLFFFAGCIIVYANDIRNRTNWIGHSYTIGDPVLLSLAEPLVEKNKSYKAIAQIQAIYINNSWAPVEGKALLYFKKDSMPPSLSYGSQLILASPLQRITNSGNPGAFDYQRYSAFNDIYHQGFLKPVDYRLTGGMVTSPLQRWLYSIRAAVLSALRKHVKGARELSVAEALLIGYRDDLDKNLVQAYSNTGVVHIIAISGLHLGMIYVSLLWMLRPFKSKKWIVWVKPLVVLGILWIFSLVAGGAPSILRSAVMFSCLLIGEMLHRKTTIYNTLAACAFLLLLFDPFALWNVGFQLSFAAVLSIVLFMKPVYNLLYVKNKLIDFFWQLNAVTIAAQVLTIPIVCYHFHQFPNLFLFSNFVIVPLASVILYCELLLVLSAYFFPWLASVAGWVAGKLLYVMNTFIERLNDFPYVVTDSLQLSVVQTAFLYVAIAGGGIWLLRRKMPALYTGLVALAMFTLLRSIDFYNRSLQKKLIVYNIPQHTAIDLINGRQVEQ